jgi:hypothetical protein
MLQRPCCSSSLFISSPLPLVVLFKRELAKKKKKGGLNKATRLDPCLFLARRLKIAVSDTLCNELPQRPALKLAHSPLSIAANDGNLFLWHGLYIMEQPTIHDKVAAAAFSELAIDVPRAFDNMLASACAVAHTRLWRNDGFERVGTSRKVSFAFVFDG